MNYAVYAAELWNIRVVFEYEKKIQSWLPVITKSIPTTASTTKTTTFKIIWREKKNMALPGFHDKNTIFLRIFEAFWVWKSLKIAANWKDWWENSEMWNYRFAYFDKIFFLGLMAVFFSHIGFGDNNAFLIARWCDLIRNLSIFLASWNFQLKMQIWDENLASIGKNA